MADTAEKQPILGLPRPEGPICMSEVEERPAEGEQSAGDRGKHIEHALAWLEHLQQPHEGKRRVIKLLPEENDVISGEILNRLGLCMHTKLLVLICRQCESGVCSEAALGHVKNRHGITTSRQDREAFEAFCKEHRIYERPEQTPIPQAGGPPVRGIAAPVPGYSCRADPFNCRYSVRDLQTLLKHARVQHGQGLAHDTDRDETMVQTIFQGVGRQYFEVDVNATAESDLGMRDYLRLEFLPSVKGDPVLAAGSDRDRPPLLHITMWDTFHEDIRKDTEQRKAAWRIKQKHLTTEHGGILNSLDKVVREHHSRAKKFLQELPHAFTAAKVLLNGPRFSPEQ